jgi:hypothetical protein
MLTTRPRWGYSADTEILTSHGWMTLSQLTYASEVATRTPDGRFEWQHPERVTFQPYEDDMVWFHSRTTDLLVAPDQRVLYHVRQRDCRGGKRIELAPKECITLARGLVGRSVALVATSRWEPADPKRDIAFTANVACSYGGRLAKRPKGFAVSATHFAAFMGMFLAEGYLGPPVGGNYPIYVTQSQKGKGFSAYQELLNCMLNREVPWRSASGGSWCFYNKALYEYLATCGKYAWGKRIPREVLDLPTNDLGTFWFYYWLGDGSLMASPGRKDIEVGQTTSKEMADGFQEVLQKLGGWSIVHTVIEKPRGDVCGRPVITRHTLYRVVRRAGNVAFATKIENVSYKGTIGRIIVPNGTVYVRRNDHPVWSVTPAGC